MSSDGGVLELERIIVNLSELFYVSEHRQL
jgi:hypothetical protein